MTSPTALPESGPYRALLNTFFPRETEARKQELWQSFLNAQGDSIDPAATNITAQHAWLQTLITAQEEIYPPLATPPSTQYQFYQNAFAAFLGPITPRQQQTYWKQFLGSIDYNFNPEPTDLAAQSAFIQYLSQVLQDTFRSVPSPDEMIKRNVLLNTFSLLISVMALLQKALATLTKNIQFDTQMQTDLTNMIAKVPILTGTSLPVGWTINTANLSKWTLGYDNISMQDVMQWMAQNIINKQSQSFTFSGNLVGPNTTQGTYAVITFSTGNPAGDPTNTSNWPSIQVTLNDSGPSTNGLGIFGSSASSNVITLALDPSKLQSMSSSQLLNTLGQTWVAFFNTGSTLDMPLQYPDADMFVTGNGSIVYPTLNVSSNGTEYESLNMTTANGTVVHSLSGLINYAQQQGLSNNAFSSGIPTPLEGTDTATTTTRTEVNTQSQQYIANLTAQQSTVKNTQSAEQSQADNMQTSLSDVTNFINQFYNTVTGLLSAIYK